MRRPWRDELFPRPIEVLFAFISLDASLAHLSQKHISVDDQRRAACERRERKQPLPPFAVAGDGGTAAMNRIAIRRGRPPTSAVYGGVRYTHMTAVICVRGASRYKGTLSIPLPSSPVRPQQVAPAPLRLAKFAVQPNGT